MASLRRYFDWWIGELRTFLPGGSSKAESHARGRLLVIHGDNEFELRASPTKKRGRDVPLRERSDWAGIKTALKTRIQGRTLTLALPQTACLVREVELPAKAIAKAESILALDLERATPFSRCDVYSAWMKAPGRTKDSLCVRQFVVAKSDIDAVRNLLRSDGFEISALAILDEEGNPLPVDLLSAEPVKSNAVDQFLTRGLLATSCLALLLLTCAVGLTFWRQRQELETLRMATADASQRAIGVREKIADASTRIKTIQSLYDRKADSVPVFWIWEEVTRILPDNTWLNEMRVENGRVYISGYAASAAELIGMLEASQFFSEVGFVAPVVNSQRPQAEQFSLQMLVQDQGS